MNRLRIVRCVDQNAARAVFGDDPAEALAQPLMESVVEALKAVGGGSRRSGASPDADSASSARVRGQSGGGSRQPDLDRQIEDQSKIRGKSAEGEPVQTVAQAIEEMQRLKGKRAEDDLPKLGRTPGFSAYTDDYLNFIKSGSGMKKPGTVAKEDHTLQKWKKHLGGLRLDKIKPVHVSAFMRKRLQAGVCKRTVKLDIIALRNVLKRARDIDQHIRALPIPPGLNRELKSATPKRPLFTHEALEKLCAA